MSDAGPSREQRAEGAGQNEEWRDVNFADSPSSSGENVVSRLQFCSIDLEKKKELKILRRFLYNNYTLTSPDYAPDFTPKLLSWILRPPTYDPYYQFGICNEDGDLLGFVAAVPHVIRIAQEARLVLQVVLLCKKRSENPELDYTNELLNELVHRGRARQIKYALFTGMFTKYPWQSVARLPLYERYLNVQQLVKSGYLKKTDDELLALLMQQQDLMEHPSLPNVRALNKNIKHEDTKIALRWLDKDSVRLDKEFRNKMWYRLAASTHLKSNDVYHNCVTPVEGVLSSFFIEKDYTNPPNPNIKFLSDFFSFYKIRQVCRKNPKQSFMTAFLYQHVISQDIDENPLVTLPEDLIAEAMKRARHEKCDLFVACQMKDLKHALIDWQFVRMEHEHERLFKRYYVFNGNFKTLDCKDVSLVLL